MIYVDTPVVVAVLTTEESTERVLAWLARANDQDLAISPWVATEVSSALSTKLRTGQISPAIRAAAMAGFARMKRDNFTILDIEATDFPAAGSLADRAELALRAGDALHLAIVQRHVAGLATLDRQLAVAATMIGVTVVEI